MAKDYYALLDISREATPEEIKSAYRRQAKKMHPDTCSGDRECFQDVQEAYETLNDPERRRAYDRRTAPRPRSRAAPQWRGFESPRRRVEPLRSWSNPPRPIEPLAPEPRSLPSSPVAPEPLIPLPHLQKTWGGSGGADQVEQLYAEVPLTPYQAERGGRVNLWVPLQVVCPECRGWGAWGARICARCAGRGRIADERPLSLSFPGGIVDGQVTRLSLEQAGIPGVTLTVRFHVEEW